MKAIAFSERRCSIGNPACGYPCRASLAGKPCLRCGFDRQDRIETVLSGELERAMKNDEAWVFKFVSLLEEYAREEGLEFPQVPDSAGRRAYLRFLVSMGCTEEELLPIVQHEIGRASRRERV